MANKIIDWQNLLSKGLLTNDESNSNFKDNIDQFPLEKVAESLSDYWNESINSLYEKLKNIFTGIDDNTNGKGHDAGYSFSNSPFVNPNINKINENYEEAREDEIQSVLHNDDNMDYTIVNSDQDNDNDIDSNDIDAVLGTLRECMLRLLMPQYQRRVEVEDLDRNFWVIGQNLTALNDFTLKFADFPIQDLIAELMGIWDNIYRIWQALQELENEMNNYFLEMNNDDKIRLMFDYGYGVLDNDKNNNAVIFTKSNAAKYGILPWISKTKLKNDKYGDSKYVYYVQYNKKLTDDFIGTTSTIINLDYKEKNKELIESLRTNAGGLIRLEEKTQTRRNLVSVLRKIRQRNYVLISFSPVDYFSNLIIVDHPFSRVVDFYRDYTYLTFQAAGNESLEQIFGNVSTENTGIWEQAGYLKFLDLLGSSYSAATNLNYTERYIDEAWDTDNIAISQEVIDSFKFLKYLISLNFDDSFTLKNNSNADAWTLINAIIELQEGSTINTLKEAVKEKDLSVIINGFYQLINDLYTYLKNIKVKNNGYSSNFYNTSSKNIFTLDTTKRVENDESNGTAPHLFSDLAEGIKLYESNESIDGQGTFSVFTGGVLPSAIWDLLSMSNSEKGVENTNELNVYNFITSLSTSTGFGNKYFYKWNNGFREDHICVDFVNDIINDREKQNTKSTIGTFTENNIRKKKNDKNELLYDFTITIPLNKIIRNNDMPAYEDFIRFNKPYPNILALEIYTVSSNSISFLSESTLRHIEELTDSDNWLAKEDEGKTVWTCYDGFYNLTTTDYSNIEENNLIPNNSDNFIQLADSSENSFFEQDYHISSSDLIDCNHDEDGQTKINNRHSFLNPIINLRFINGRTDCQEIEIVITKDETTIPVRTETIVYVGGAKIVRMGAFFPLLIDSDTKEATSPTLERVTKETMSVSVDGNNKTSNYNSSTYGIGSYVVRNSNDVWWTNEAFRKAAEVNNDKIYITYTNYRNYIAKYGKYQLPNYYDRKSIFKNNKNDCKNSNADGYVRNAGYDFINQMCGYDSFLQYGDEETKYNNPQLPYDNITTDVYTSNNAVSKDLRDYHYESFWTDEKSAQKEENKVLLVATEIGTEVYWGSSGSQWFKGRVCYLYLIFNGDNRNVYTLAKLALGDEFFAEKSANNVNGGDGYFEEVDGGRWRRFMFVTDDNGITLKRTKSNGKIIYKLNNAQGLVLLCDKNKTENKDDTEKTLQSIQEKTGIALQLGGDSYNNLIEASQSVSSLYNYSDDGYDRIVGFAKWTLDANEQEITDETESNAERNISESVTFSLSDDYKMVRKINGNWESDTTIFTMQSGDWFYEKDYEDDDVINNLSSIEYSGHSSMSVYSEQKDYNITYCLPANGVSSTYHK